MFVLSFCFTTFSRCSNSRRPWRPRTTPRSPRCNRSPEAKRHQPSPPQSSTGRLQRLQKRIVCSLFSNSEFHTSKKFRQKWSPLFSSLFSLRLFSVDWDANKSWLMGVKLEAQSQMHPEISTDIQRYLDFVFCLFRVFFVSSLFRCVNGCGSAQL